MNFRTTTLCLLLLAASPLLVYSQEGARHHGMTAEEMTQSMQRSIEALGSISGDFKTYFSRDALSSRTLPGLVYEGQRFLYSEFSMRYRHDGGLMFLDGRWGYEVDGEYFYAPVAFAFDGDRLRSLNKLANAGKIGPLDRTFQDWQTPLVLLGKGIGYEPSRDLADLLIKPTYDGVEDDLVVIQSPYSDASLPDDYPLKCKAWLDPRIGFLPRKIELYDGNRHVRKMSIVVSEFKNYASGVWVPTAGEYTCFKSTKDPKKSDPGSGGGSENEGRPANETAWVEKPLGMGTWYFEFEPSTVSVNQTFDEDEYRFEFPASTHVRDTERDTVIIVGGESSDLARGTPWVTWSILVLAAVALVSVVAYRKYRLACVGGLMFFSLPGCTGDTHDSTIAEIDSRNGILVEGGPYRELEPQLGGGVLQADFVMVNNNDFPVELEPNVTTSCGCSSASLSALRVAPGERTTLSLNINVPERDLTKQTIVARIMMKSPQDLDPEQIALTYDVELPWQVQPPALTVSGYPGQRVEQTITIHRHRIHDLAVKSVEGNPPSVVEVGQIEGFDESGRLQVPLQVVLPGIRSSGVAHVRIVPTQEELHPITVPINYRVQRPVHASPSQLFVSDETPDEERFTIDLRSEYAFRISKVKERPGITAHPSTEETSTTNQLVVKVTKSALVDVLTPVVLNIELPGKGVRTELDIPVIRPATES